jgi:nitrite reductase/ring-hydroxylating ferredoxin subunit
MTGAMPGLKSGRVAVAGPGLDNNAGCLTTQEDEPMAFTKVATASEVPPGTARQVSVNGRTIALFNVGGTYHAIDDACTHRGASLAEGECDGSEVICPWHGARFDLATGAARTPPAPRGVNAYKVQVVGDDIQIDV